MSEICFDKETFNIYLFLLFCVITFLFYTSRENFSTVDLNGSLTKDQLLIKVTELQEQLFNSKLNNQLCQKELQIKSQQSCGSGSSNKFLEKIYNPLERPDIVYPGGTLRSQGYNANQMNQQLGYISNHTGKYPIYGRYKYPGKSDKWEYYTIDDSRGRIKIPFKTKNYDELYDGDQVDIPNLGNFTFTKYDQEDIKYDPNLL
jgi:hypothetical protein